MNNLPLISITISDSERPSQPKLLKYPVNKSINPKTKKTKSFSSSWYSRFSWLEYSVEKDAALCYCCRNFTANKANSAGASAFTTTGYRNWANALDKGKGFMQHERSELHKNSYANWMTWQKFKEGSEKNIIQRLCPDRNAVACENREYLRHLFKYVLWFTTNELAMRGDDESDESKNPGKWITFIKLQLEMNPTFRELHNKVTKSKSTDYTSKTSVNGFIEIIADSVRKVICSQIKDAGMFSALIDESKDTAKREEFAIAVRYFAHKVVERFYDLKHLESFDARTIMNVTKEIVENIIQISEGSIIVSLGADGASVMSGEFGGVAELLRSEHFKWLIYIHSTAHRINLLVNDLIKDSNLAVDVINTINSLYSFLNIPKVRMVYEKIHQELFPKSQIKHLVQQIEIRWGCKFEAVDLMTDKPQVILATLVRVTQNPDVHDRKHVEQASGFYHKLISGKFVISLITLKAYLAEMYYLSKELQSEEINWTDVRYEIERVKQSISTIDDDKLRTEASIYSEKIGIPFNNLALELPIHATRSAATNNAVSRTEKTIQDLNSYMKQKIKEEFRVRFDEKNIEILKALEALDASKENYLDIDALDYLIDHFDCLNVNRSILAIEISRAKMDFRMGLPISEKRSENLMKLIGLKNTIATTTATVERSFSGMNRVCSILRSRTTANRLGDLLCISLNKDLANELDVDVLIDNWAVKSNRRIIV